MLVLCHLLLLVNMARCEGPREKQRFAMLRLGMAEQQGSRSKAASAGFLRAVSSRLEVDVKLTEIVFCGGTGAVKPPGKSILQQARPRLVPGLVSSRPKCHWQQPRCLPPALRPGLGSTVL